MALAHLFNLITFEPDDWVATDTEPDAPRIVLNECTITRRGGLEPDAWHAMVPADQLARIRLGTFSFEMPGRIQLWSTHSYDGSRDVDPDVSLPLCAIVDVEADTIGRVAGETSERPISYRVLVMDYRRAWREPRGGRLLKGMINRDPLPSGQTLITNSDLITACASAMGVTLLIPAPVNDAEPARDLDWTCAHAPSELQALLEHTGSVFAPLTSGLAQIVTPGQGLAPTPPAGTLIRDVTLQAIDRRASVVIFTSAPAAKIRTFDDTMTGTGTPTWKYVAQDPQDHDRWKPLNSIAALGADHAAAWAADLKDVAEQYRPRLREQIYRCIQLDPTKYPPGKVVLLTQAIDVDANETAPFLKLSTVLQQLANGSFGQQPSGCVLASSSVVQSDNVLIFPTPLVKLASASTTARRQQLTGTEVAIAEASLKPTFSVQGWDSTNSAREISVFGFNIVSGTVTAMSDADARAALVGYRPDTSVVNSPDLGEITLNGGTTTANRNTEAKAAKALSYANRVVNVGDGSPMRELTVKGFWPVDIDAAVSEVVYDPRTVTTVVTLYGWSCASRQGERR